MGEMDMGDLPGAPLESSTATTEKTTTETEQAWRNEELAEQLRSEARALLDPPTHFATPSWMGPSTHEQAPPQVPLQAGPVDDEVSVYAPAPLQAPDSVPDRAHWVERQKPRMFVGLLMTSALIGAIASLVLAVVNQSIVAVGGLVLCGLIAVIFRGALMSTGLTTVDLQGSTLRIRKDAELSVFHLADPALLVEETGTPGGSDWKVVLESVHHHGITLTAANVNAAEFHEILAHYRGLAERERQDRYNRFNR